MDWELLGLVKEESEVLGAWPKDGWINGQINRWMEWINGWTQGQKDNITPDLIS